MKSKPKGFKKLKIGIDIDNVVSDTYVALVGKFNEVYGTSIRIDEVLDYYYLEKHSGIEKEEVQEFIYTSLEREDFSLAIKPYEDATAVIKQWSSQGHSIHYITARPTSLGEVTKKWLEKHDFWVKSATLDLFDESIEYKSDSDYKRQVIEKIGINLLIEDSKENAKILDIPVLLLDRPWNKGELPENVKRVSNWKEIEREVSL